MNRRQIVACQSTGKEGVDALRWACGSHDRSKHSTCADIKTARIYLEAEMEANPALRVRVEGFDGDEETQPGMSVVGLASPFLIWFQ